MPHRLDENELRDALAELTCWDGHIETGIHCHRELPSFRHVIRLVSAVADAAEEMDHHPDIDIRYRSVTFTLVTHSENAVTDLDVTLARRIEELAAEVQA